MKFDGFGAIFGGIMSLNKPMKSVTEHVIEQSLIKHPAHILTASFQSHFSEETWWYMRRKFPNNGIIPFIRHASLSFSSEGTFLDIGPRFSIHEMTR